MALSRVTTWVAGQVLTAAALNGEFNNVLNNPISLVSPTTGAINFNLQAHTNLLPGTITGTSGISGQTLMVTSSGTPLAFGNPYVGSRVRNMQMVASSQNAQFTADIYLLKSTNDSQTFSIASTASFTVNLNTAGPAANGRDQAGSFASTYIHYYGITSGAGSTIPTGIVSSQPPSVGPTLPAGYVGWVYLASVIYSSASTTINNVRARGTNVWNDAVLSVLTNGQSTTAATVAIAAQVPTVAQNVLYNVGINNQAGGGAATVALQSASGTNTVAWTAVTGTPYNTFVEYPAIAPFYIWSTNPAPNGLTLSVAGYSVPNGDAA